jgi:hypothetical protein
LQESAKGGPLGSQGVQLSKMELEDVVIFHGGKLKKLKVITKNPT